MLYRESLKATKHLYVCVKVRSTKPDKRIVSDQKKLSEIVKSALSKFFTVKVSKLPSIFTYVLRCGVRSTTSESLVI